MVKTSNILLLSFLFTVNCLSQINSTSDFNYTVNYITNEEGLSSNKVNAICKDTYGFIWFGTNVGLNRYDGNSIISYQNIEGDTSSISNNIIRDILKDSEGNLWIGTDNGLNIYNPDIDAFDRVDLDINYTGKDFIWQLFEDMNGVLWIASRHGLYYKEKNSTHILAFKKFKNLPEGATVYSVYVDSRNNLWAGTQNNGLFLYSFNSNESKHFANIANDEKSISGNWIKDLYEDKNGDFWIGTARNGLNRYNYELSSFSRISVDGEFTYKEDIRKITEDNMGQLWIGSGFGLFLKNPESEVFTRFAHTNNDYTKLNQNSIYNIYIDDMDIIWIGTFSGGVNFIDLSQKKFAHFHSVTDNNLFLNSKSVYTIYEDSKNNLWIGTGSGGINHLDRSTRTFEYLTNDPDNINSLCGNNVKAIVEDKSGNFWIGTYRNGLDYYNTKTKKFKHYKASDNNSNSIVNNNIYDLLIDSEDNLWIATQLGIDLIPFGSDKIIHLTKEGKDSNFDGAFFRTIYEDSNKNIWIGTINQGLLLFNKTDSSFTEFKRDLISGGIYSISEDNRNQLWIGGKDGLFYLDKQKDSVINYTIEDGLPATVVLKTFDDKAGNLWISTTAGISKFINGVNTPQILKFRNYSTRDGLQNKQFVYNSNDKSRSGKIYFGGINGFNAFYPEELEDNKHKATPVITGLKIFNQDVAIGEKIEGKIVLEKPIIKTEELVLSYKHYFITLQFAALHYSQPNEINYAYRLEGFDTKNSDWNYTNAANHSVTYTNLKGGDYLFRIKASNNDGVWNDDPTILKIKVLPPFWRTPWFISLSIFIALLLAATFFYVRINKLKRQKKVLEQTVRERTADLEQTNRVLIEQQQIVEEQSEELLIQTEELVSANSNLKELNSTKDKFFSIIAHDIKNPFQAVLGFSEILVMKFDTLEPSKQKEFSKHIFDSSKLIYNLLENLLQWSMAQSKNIQFAPTNFLCDEIINDTLLLSQEKISNKKIEVLFDSKEKIELYADRNMITTVVRNILSNAIKFTGIEGTIEISCQKKNNDVEFCIRDSGLGMKLEDAQKLFKIDEHLTTEGTAGEKGTGLGLLVCKEFVERHSGKIWVESELGKGSAFFFTIVSDQQKSDILV